MSLAGATVVAAVNHWDLALATHAVNYPHVEHYSDNALDFDFTRLPRHRFGHLSPECTYYAVRARGGKPGPRRDESRATAFCTPRYARACEPEAVTVENVEEYAASPEAAKVVRAMRRMDYGHRRFVLDSVHFGPPQSRRRVFEVYRLLGTRRNQVRQVGNALVCDVAEWLTARVMEECS